MLSVRALVSLCLASLVSVAALTAQQPGEALCGACSTTGKLPLEVDPRWNIEQQHGDTWKVLFCADAIEAADMALPWKPCPRCKTPSVQAAAQAEWDKLSAANATWLAARRKVDEQIACDDMAHVETTHFVISWNIPSTKTADKKTYKMHEAAHLYAQRMEDYYAKFQAAFGITDAQNMRNKHYFYAVEKEQEALTLGPIYAGLSGMGTVKRAGGADKESVVVMWRNKSEHPSDEDFHRHWLHSVTHQLTSVFYDVKWFKVGEKGLSPPWLNDKYGWLDEGLAHWYEMEFDGQATTYCIREHDAKARWKGGDWKKNVWKAVMAEETPSFPEVITKPTQALSAEEHQFAWSWIDFLMQKDTLAMGTALRLAKMDRPTRDLLQEAWGLTTFGFEMEWAEWVKVEYAPSNKEGKIDPRAQLPQVPQGRR